MHVSEGERFIALFGQLLTPCARDTAGRVLGQFPCPSLVGYCVTHVQEDGCDYANADEPQLKAVTQDVPRGVYRTVKVGGHGLHGGQHEVNEMRCEKKKKEKKQDSLCPGL